MPEESDLFTVDYPSRSADELWPALQRALATMDLQEADEAARTARFSSGVSLTSWGEHLIAHVVDRSEGGSRVMVRGRPKGSFLTTKWGEELHAKQVEKDLTRSIDDALVEVA